MKTKNPDYFTYDKRTKKYQVRKTIKGKFHYFGHYSNKKDAQFIVNGLKKANWDIEKLQPKYKEKLSLNKKPKGYSQDKRNGKYMVKKWLNGKCHDFGRVPTEQDAIEYVQILDECNYDVNLLPRKYKKYLPKKVTGEPKHYYKSEQGYQVTKTINKKNYYFGVYPTEELAKQAVEELKKLNWDLEEFNLKHSFKYSKPSPVRKYTKRNTYDKSVGSLSNPIYSKTKPKSSVNDATLYGTYNHKQQEKEKLFEISNID